jgi:hypothetical protein
MRRLAPALLLLTLLPGCILAIGNEGLDDKKGVKRLEQLERRVSALEDELYHGHAMMDEDVLEDDDDGPAMR